MAQDPLKTEAPPAYNDVVKDAPPAYSDVFGVKEIQAQMQEARSEGGSPARAGLKICNVLCGSIVCGVFVIVLAALPLAMIVIGSMNVHRCEQSTLTPIFLIVFGCVSLLQTGIHIFRMICGRSKDSERTERANQGSNCCETIISIFLFVWIIIGSYWVFSLWNQWNSSDCNREAQCCDPVLVYFSFITMLLIYATGVLCCCCIVCCICCCAFVAAGSAAADS